MLLDSTIVDCPDYWQSIVPEHWVPSFPCTQGPVLLCLCPKVDWSDCKTRNCRSSLFHPRKGEHSVVWGCHELCPVYVKIGCPSESRKSVTMTATSFETQVYLSADCGDLFIREGPRSCYDLPKCVCHCTLLEQVEFRGDDFIFECSDDVLMGTLLQILDNPIVVAFFELFDCDNVAGWSFRKNCRSVKFDL